jgi:lactam utilization protein B
VDLNSDLGERFGAWRLGDDDALLSIVNSVNVACAFMPVTRRRCAGCAPARSSSGWRSGPGSATGMAVDGTVVAVDGTVVDCRIASLCVHGDTPGAVELAKRVRDELVSADLQLTPSAFG